MENDAEEEDDELATLAGVGDIVEGVEGVFGSLISPVTAAVAARSRSTLKADPETAAVGEGPFKSGLPLEVGESWCWEAPPAEAN